MKEVTEKYIERAVKRFTDDGWEHKEYISGRLLFEAKKGKTSVRQSVADFRKWNKSKGFTWDYTWYIMPDTKIASLILYL